MNMYKACTQSSFVMLLLGVLMNNIIESFSNPAQSAQDSCQVDTDCQKGGQQNRCCSQFYFCGTGPDYCAEGMKPQNNYLICVIYQWLPKD